MPRPNSWALGTKLALVASPFLLIAIALIAATLWVSWQLDGGAAAVNEAGRMRMQSYRLSLSVSLGDRGAAAAQVREFEQSIALLRHGDAERPLFVPWDATIQAQFEQVARSWEQYRDRWTRAEPRALSGLPGQTAALASQIDLFVSGIEVHLSRWTAILHLLQTAMMALAVIGAAALLYTGYLFVLEPVGLLKRATERLQAGELDARVERLSRDEFGTLAQGFNSMADHLQSMYRNLEAKVAEKTAELEDKRERLETLYSVTTLVANAASLDELAGGFTDRVQRVAHADAVALRWSDEANERYLMLASAGLPQAMIEEEHCIRAHECHCGSPGPTPGARVIPIHGMAPTRMGHCAAAGFQTVVSLPIRLKDRLMGEVDLFFHARVEPTEAERSLLEALTAHLASAMENLRLTALEKEAAVSQERELLACELHDSIAQSLAFLKIQVQLMRDALDSGNADRIRHVLAEIDLGVKESYGDVRELLLNFRTRASEEDIEPALQTTLRKFEHHSGLAASLSMQGQGMPLPPDVQVQVLHVVQEALSNVRKHARATRVEVIVEQQPVWRFEVRDDGVGFDASRELDETHVGQRIMSERARRIGATLELRSGPGLGCSVVLTLPSKPVDSPSAAPDTPRLQALVQ